MRVSMGYCTLRILGLLSQIYVALACICEFLNSFFVKAYKGNDILHSPNRPVSQWGHFLFFFKMWGHSTIRVGKLKLL